MPSQSRTVGIIGGMGPEATVELMRRVIASTPANDDADHIRMIVDNNPKIPSRIAAIIERSGPSPAPTMVAMARGLVKAGAEFLAIPCNTAHFYLPEVQSAVDVPVLDMISATAGHLTGFDPRARRAGILASPATRIVGLLQQRFSEYEIDTHFPNDNDEAVLLEVIRAVKGSGVPVSLQRAYRQVVGNLAASNVNALVIACTELSLIDRPSSDVPVVDTLDILVASIIAHAFDLPQKQDVLPAEVSQRDLA